MGVVSLSNQFITRMDAILNVILKIDTEQEAHCNS